MGWDEQPEQDVWFSVDPKGRPEEEEPTRRRRGPSFLSVLLGLVVVAIAVVAWVNRSSEDTATPRPTPSPATPTPTSDRFSPSPATPTPEPTVTVTSIGRAPLGRTSPWDLIVLDADRLSRVEMATGRVTTSRLQLSEGPPMVLLPARDRILVQPVYEGVGFVVADDGTVRSPTGLPPGVPIPIPGTERLWWAPAEYGAAGNRVEQRRITGQVVPGTSTSLPSDIWSGSARTDGAGGVLVDGPDGTYRLEKGALRRITTGWVLGAGHAGWLVNECDDDHRCRLAFVGRTGGRRALGAALANPTAGGIDPAGRLAAVVEGRPAGNVLVLLDLRTGARRTVETVAPAIGALGAAVAWSPDSSWLLVADERGRVLAVEPATGRSVDLLENAAQVVALAVRAPPR